MTRRLELIDRVARLVDDLGPITHDVVLVGGCAAAAYEIGPRDVRWTEDIDLVVHGSYLQWVRFMDHMRGRLFHEPREGSFCRLVRDDFIVDVVPDNEPSIESNRWYREAYDQRVEVPAMRSIHVISPLHFLATKFDAFHGPGRADGGDLYASHDIEDILEVTGGVAGLLDEVERGDDAVHRYVRAELRQIATQRDGLEIVSFHYEGDAGSQGQARLLHERMLTLRSR